ncbi:MAG: hypothetical protein ACLFVZ_07745, partial [Actinomycetota bacterium]
RPKRLMAVGFLKRVAREHSVTTAGLCLGFGLSVAAVVLAAVWFADFAIRLGQVLGRRTRTAGARFPNLGS